MAKTIAVVGVGPGIGMAVAEHFGREGFNVALLSRNARALKEFAEALNAKGINAAAFPANIIDRPGLEAALKAAIDHFGSIDVLEFGPTPTPDSLRTPRNIDVENEQFHLDLTVLGSIAAVRAVLPGMLARKQGTLLFTTAASAQHPAPFTASFGVAAGAQLNYVRLLNQDLKAEGIHAAIVAVAGLVTQEGQEHSMSSHGLSMVTAQEVARIHWDQHVKRDQIEVYAGDIQPLLKILGKT